MNNKMISHKVYGVWEYEREIEDLNKRSLEGWQLEKGGCFHSEFVRNETIRYVYQIDYAPKLEDKEMYISFFEEQGWEYINSTFNGWHYFRKKYEEGMIREDMEIYSDRESLVEMQKRYGRIMYICAFFFSIGTVLYGGDALQSKDDIAPIMIALLYFLGAAVFWLAVWNQKRKQQGKEELVKIRYEVVIILWLILLALTFLFIII